MKKAVMKKLRSNSGESIGETLVALLISALALVMLAGAISTAARLITKSETVMEKYYTGMNGLGTPATSGTDTLTVTLTSGASTVHLFGNDDPSSTVTVKCYVNGDGFVNKPVMAYTVE